MSTSILHYKSSFLFFFLSIFKIFIKSNSIFPFFPPHLDLYGHTAVARGDVIIFFGGERDRADGSGSIINQDLIYYDVVSNMWSAPSQSLRRLHLEPEEDNDLDFDSDHEDNNSTESKPIPVLRHACCLSENGESIFISGGQFKQDEDSNNSGTLGVTSQLCRFDIETEKWVILRDFVARYDHTITASNRKIWAFGGLTPEINRSIDVVWYDLDTDAVGSINIIDDPMALSYPTPSAANHAYTPGYQGTILDVSLPGPATPNYPLSITAIDLSTFKKRSIVHSSFVFQDCIWTNIFSRGPAFIVLGRPGNLEDNDQHMTHVFYWDLRDFGFLDPVAQTKPDEFEGTLSYDFLRMFREGTLTDFELFAVQGNERPPLFHDTIDSNIDIKPQQQIQLTQTVSTPTAASTYDHLPNNSLLDRNSPAPSLRAIDGVMGDNDSAVDFSMTSSVHKTTSSQLPTPNNAIGQDNNSTKSTGSSNESFPPSPEPLHKSSSMLRNSTVGNNTTTKDNVPIFTLSRPIRVHSLVLYTRWPHFRRIMVNQMSEFHSRKMYLPEPEQWVRKLVEFMYSDSLEGFSLDDVSGLLVLANLYELPRLRRLCLEHISKNSVTCNNAVIVYWRSYTANESDLQKTAAAYCLRHWGEVVRTEEFQELPRDIMIMLCQEAMSPSAIIQKNTDQEQLELERQHQQQQERRRVERQFYQKQQRQRRRQRNEQDENGRSSRNLSGENRRTGSPAVQGAISRAAQQFSSEMDNSTVNAGIAASAVTVSSSSIGTAGVSATPAVATTVTASPSHVWTSSLPNSSSGDPGDISRDGFSEYQPPSSENGSSLSSSHENDSDNNNDNMGSAEGRPSNASTPRARRQFNLPTSYSRPSYNANGHRWEEILQASRASSATPQSTETREGWDGVYDDLADDMDLM